jgi:serine/threonine protein kinase
MGVGRVTEIYRGFFTPSGTAVKVAGTVGAALAIADRIASTTLTSTPESLLVSVPVGLALGAGGYRLVNWISSRKASVLQEQIDSLLAENEGLRAKLTEHNTTFSEVRELTVRKGEEEFQNKYLLSDKIGEGGTASVRFAINLSAGNHLEVIKITKREYSGDDKHRKRVFREADITMTTLSDHEKIVKVYGYGETDEGPFIVMEYVRGSSLAAEISKYGKLPLLKAIYWMIGIAEVFAAMHNVGVIHRDAKPQNIMITEEGEIKIIDFGIAKITGREVTKLTQAGSIFGTPEYMAPEQLDGKEVNNQTDLYALGLIFYEMLIGRSPFIGKSESLEWLKLLGRLHNAWTNWDRGKFPDIASDIGRPDLSEKLKNIFSRLLHPDRNKRYLSALEFARDLMSLREVDPGYEPTGHGDEPKGIKRA